MIYRIFLIVFLTLFYSLCSAGEKRYRVEILVLSHLQHEAAPSNAGWLRDFSSALEFPQDEEGTETQDDELLPDEDQPAEPWADVIAVESMGDAMREAWRRLRLSAQFRPEQYLSWEQSVEEPFPSLRFHDLEVVLIDDPYADLRKIDAFEAELPDPTLFYRIDGTVMLRRSRFLHLELDLELRQPLFDEQQSTPALNLGDENESGQPERPFSKSFLIHKLKQSRQVKSQRMEYFDSPVLGVLAWITSFELEDEAEGNADRVKPG